MDVPTNKDGVGCGACLCEEAQLKVSETLASSQICQGKRRSRNSSIEKTLGIGSGIDLIDNTDLRDRFFDRDL